MNQGDVTMGHFSSPWDRDRFIIMTLTAAKALHLVFAGLGPETPSLVSFGHLNVFHRKRQDRIDLLFIIKGSRRIFVDLNNAAFSGICGAPWKNEQQCRQYPPEVILKYWCLQINPEIVAF